MTIRPKAIRKGRFLIVFSIGLWIGVATGTAITQTQTPTGGTFEAVRINRTNAGLEVLARVQGYTAYQVKVFRGRPNQIVIDMDGVIFVRAERKIPVGDAGVTAVRTGQFEPTIARLVVDLSGEVPVYEATRTDEGLRLFIVAPAEVKTPVSVKVEALPPVRTETKVEPPPVKTETIPPVKAETKVEPPPVKAKEPPQVKAEAPEKAAKVGEKPEAPPVKPAEKPAEKPEDKPVVAPPPDAKRILDEMNAERELLRRKRFRITAEFASFGPREGVLKDVFKGGFCYGAQVVYGFAEFAEVWLAENVYGKILEAGSTAGARKTRLIPIEAGLNFRIARGVVNPYVGVGGGLFQYREEGPAGTIKATKLGFATQAGVFIRIGGFLLIDLFGKYKYCPIEIAGSQVDVGGFYFGFGLGGEF